jgi:hypothetical protein
MKTLTLKDAAQLTVFIRHCCSNFLTTKNFLELIPIHGTTAGEDTFSEIGNLLK